MDVRRKRGFYLGMQAKLVAGMDEIRLAGTDALHLL